MMIAKIYQKMMKETIAGMSFLTNHENQIMKEDNKKTLDFIFPKIIKWINTTKKKSNKKKFNDNSFFYLLF